MAADSFAEAGRCAQQRRCCAHSRCAARHPPGCLRRRSGGCVRAAAAGAPQTAARTLTGCKSCHAVGPRHRLQWSCIQRKRDDWRQREGHMGPLRLPSTWQPWIQSCTSSVFWHCCTSAGAESEHKWSVKKQWCAARRVGRCWLSGGGGACWEASPGAGPCQPPAFAAGPAVPFGRESRGRCAALWTSSALVHMHASAPA